MIKLTPVAAAVALASLLSAGAAQADSFFWAVNQFRTVQKLNGDTGAVVDSFAVPVGSGTAASIAVVGNKGYHTLLGDTNIFAVDMTTHASLAVAFTIAPDSFINGITPDAFGHLWFSGGNSAPLREYNTAGDLLSTHTFPTAAGGYRDGSVVFGGFVVANRGDQTGPYDKYSISAGNTPLSLVTSSFITTTGPGSNGIAFNGVNFYTSDEQAHKVSKWDVNGNFVSIANLDPGSRYENWTFASQDIVISVPEPTTYALTFMGLALVGAVANRRRKSTLIG